MIKQNTHYTQIQQQPFTLPKGNLAVYCVFHRYNNFVKVITHGRDYRTVSSQVNLNQWQNKAGRNGKQDVYPVENENHFISYDEEIDKVKNPEGDDGFKYVI